MTDESHLDNRYFIDQHVYNCPFCNRRNVSYCVRYSVAFDWTEKKRCYAYIIECNSCKKDSMHLTFDRLEIYEVSSGNVQYQFRIPVDVDAGELLDSAFFYSVPTSFFVLDERIPRKLRELLTEAEGSLKSNFLTGASACARKMIYELEVLSQATGDNYDDRIKSLKTIHPEVEPSFFDTLLTIQQMTSSKVHESSLDGWTAAHLRVILKTLSEVLREMYVVPALRQDRRKAILELRDKLVPSTPEAPPKPSST